MHTEIFHPCTQCTSPIVCGEVRACDLGIGRPGANRNSMVKAEDCVRCNEWLMRYGFSAPCHTIVPTDVHNSKSYGGMVGGIYVEIAAERRRAHAKHDTTGHSAEKQGPMWWRWMPILTEELGESAEAWQDLANAEPEQYGNALRHLKAELVQVAAMAAAWADSVQRGIDLWEIER